MSICRMRYQITGINMQTNRNEVSHTHINGNSIFFLPFSFRHLFSSSCFALPLTVAFILFLSMCDRCTGIVSGYISHCPFHSLSFAVQSKL